ncbi:hypothetical protein [Streptomyces xanthochromogenes]|uniref:hypothetical protein n=1 Tax=Streptomyces xanthochromogenes TaxID=67384 RepID=UPI0034290887
MTENKALKTAIRERMATTGEPYNVARRTVIAQHQASAADESVAASIGHRGALPGRGRINSTFPVMPKLGLPVMPKVGLPVMPKLALPVMPKVGLPVMPKLNLPPVKFDFNG